MAKKIENEEFEKKMPAAPPTKEDVSPKKKGKRKVVVINVPKRKKRLRTPSHILRICSVWCFGFLIFFLTMPFLVVTFYITEDLEVTPEPSKAYQMLATQEEINDASKKLKEALEHLEKRPTPETSAEESSDVTSAEASESSEASQAAKENAGSTVREMETISYQWNYHVSEQVDVTELTDLVEQAKKVERDEMTETSLEKLNTAVLNAHKVLCADVTVQQNALQMMLGGAVGEAYGDFSYVGNVFLRGLCSFALGILPLLGIFACIFDKKRHIKHVIVMLCCVLAVGDIFLAIYPYIGIGTVLSITMYILIAVLNVASIYALQQERYIVKHPELEAEFTEKHPQFVKALINHKSFDAPDYKPDPKAHEVESARNAKKRMRKKKKK